MDTYTRIKYKSKLQKIKAEFSHTKPIGAEAKRLGVYHILQDWGFDKFWKELAK